jgi:hypothetical protein
VWQNPCMAPKGGQTDGAALGSSRCCGGGRRRLRTPPHGWGKRRALPLLNWHRLSAVGIVLTV